MLSIMDGEQLDVIVVGGGSAGLSAALVLGRVRRRVLVLSGGLPRNAPASASHGFLTRDGASPLELLALARQQLEPYPVQVLDEQALSAKAVADGFEVVTESGQTFRARRIVLASGVTDLLPDLPGLRQGWGQTVHHCPYCHGWEVRDQRVAVYVPQSADNAYHLSVMLRQLTPHLTLLTAGPHQLTPQQHARLLALGVKLDERPLTGWNGSQMEFEDGSTIPFEAVFVGPNQQQRSDLAAQLGCAVLGSGPMSGIWLSVQLQSGLTSVPGIYAAGDLIGEQWVSFAVASGSRAGAALNAELCFLDAERAGQSADEQAV